jgi:hypothetical protein
MIKPDMSGNPAFDAMGDPAEFIKKLWDAMPLSLSGIPGMVMPTLSVEEIDKQIADMKAVEGWLDMNRNMLRSTIQALEVQSATISALHAMNDTFRNAGQTSSGTGKATASKSSSGKSTDAGGQSNPFIDSLQAMGSNGDAAAWWDKLQAQFNQTVQSVMAQQSSTPAAKPKATSRKSKAPAAKPAARKPTSKKPAK